MEKNVLCELNNERERCRQRLEGLKKNCSVLIKFILKNKDFFANHEADVLEALADLEQEVMSTINKTLKYIL